MDALWVHVSDVDSAAAFQEVLGANAHRLRSSLARRFASFSLAMRSAVSSSSISCRENASAICSK